MRENPENWIPILQQAGGMMCECVSVSVSLGQSRLRCGVAIA